MVALKVGVFKETVSVSFFISLIIGAGQAISFDHLQILRVLAETPDNRRLTPDGLRVTWGRV